jgi:tRNA 5-methylaminomethyl-2-thiouridine biosynthesis bifunctional protein
VVAQTTTAPQAEAVLKVAAAHPELAPLAQQLVDQYWGFLPGIHRLRFENGHVTLTLSVGVQTNEVIATHLVPSTVTIIDTVIIIGAGIAGAGTARALAERGWQVTVIDAGAEPAAGASGLPVGVVAPHTSHDDSGVSRLSRAGLRLMEQTMRALLIEGVDWASTGVLERRLPGKTRRAGVPLSWLDTDADSHTAKDWTVKAPPPAPDDAYWHSHGAWVRPAKLVRALLDHPRITWRGNAQVDSLKHHNGQWQLKQGDTLLAESERVVIAAGPGSATLIAAATHDDMNLRINPLRGQVSWGLMSEVLSEIPNAPMPLTPVNGNGSFVHSIPTDEGLAWFTGATFDRLNDQPILLDADHAENLVRLQALQPDTAAALAPLFETEAKNKTVAPSVRGWAGVRCGVHDRLPLVGPVWNAPAGLYLNTAMGSRGLTLALLCGELLAAQWHGEPLPIENKLAKFLAADRFKQKP